MRRQMGGVRLNRSAINKARSKPGWREFLQLAEIGVPCLSVFPFPVPTSPALIDATMRRGSRSRGELRLARAWRRAVERSL